MWKVKGDVLETRDSGMDAKVQAKQVEKFIEEKSGLYSD